MDTLSVEDPAGVCACRLHLRTGDTLQPVTCHHVSAGPAAKLLARQPLDSEVVSNIKIFSLGLNSVTWMPQPPAVMPKCPVGYALAKASTAPPSAGTAAVTHWGSTATTAK